MSYSRADKAIIDRYMKEIDDQIESIVNSATNVKITGDAYYISADGDDNNDGRSPETAWATPDKLRSARLKYGDGVFFRRGDSFRIVNAIGTVNGVTYSAYGKGPKPRIVCSVDGSGADKWEATEYKNIYRLIEKIPGKDRDVGTIVFDGGKAWGIQIQKTSEGNRLEIGRVFNGIEWFDTTKGAFEDQRDLDNNLEFYHNWEEDTVYLYCKDGNPGEVFKSIELVDKGHGFSLGNNIGIVIDNIEIFGSGSHGIGGGTIKDVTVQYCVLKWIGGSIQGKYIFNTNYGVRFGNAVESYGSSENFTIRYCYASQIYDCCWTVQFQQAAVMKNIHMYGNVTEFANTGLEVWQNGGVLTGMQLHNNYTRFDGYGWSHQRPNKDPNFFYGAGEVARYNSDNDVSYNINLFSSKYCLKARPVGPDFYNFHDNVYIMEEDKYVGWIPENPISCDLPMKVTPYDEETITRLQDMGFESGSKYYITEKEPLGDMYKLCIPKE